MLKAHADLRRALVETAELIRQDAWVRKSKIVNARRARGTWYMSRNRYITLGFELGPTTMIELPYRTYPGYVIYHLTPNGNLFESQILDKEEARAVRIENLPLDRPMDIAQQLSDLRSNLRYMI